MSRPPPKMDAMHTLRRLKRRARADELKRDPLKLRGWTRRVRDKLANGERLYCEMTHDGPHYWLEPCCSEVSSRIVDELVEKGIVKPMGDDLFLGKGQSFELKRNHDER